MIWGGFNGDGRGGRWVVSLFDQCTFQAIMISARDHQLNYTSQSPNKLPFRRHYTIVDWNYLDKQPLITQPADTRIVPVQLAIHVGKSFVDIDAHRQVAVGTWMWILLQRILCSVYTIRLYYLERRTSKRLSAEFQLCMARADCRTNYPKKKHKKQNEQRKRLVTPESLKSLPALGVSRLKLETCRSILLRLMFAVCIRATPPAKLLIGF